MEAILFYFFSSIALFSSFSVITARKPVRALLSLIVTMFSLAVLFLLLGAYFIAMVHLVVYAGAVLVLFLFVIMLQGVGASEIPLNLRFRRSYVALVFFVSAAFIASVSFILARVPTTASSIAPGSVEAIGQALFTRFLLPFELTSLVLLLGVFAAVFLAKKEDA